jgi:hypothetical protein
MSIGELTAQDLAALAIWIRQIVRGMLPPQPLIGFVQPDTYNPKDGTCEAVVGATLCLDGDVDEFGNQTHPLRLRAPIFVSYIGHQGGPVGGERVAMIHTEGGPIFLLYHGADDSPGAPAGETWLQHHRDDETYVKLQNSGALGLGALSKVVGLAPKFYFGEDNSPDAHAIARQQDNQKLARDIIAACQNAVQQLASMVQSGPGVPPPTIADVTAQASSTSYTA